MYKFTRFFIFLGLVVSWSLLVAGHECYAQDKIVAVVNNDIITRKDLSDFMNFMRMQLSHQYKGKELDAKVAETKRGLLDKLIEDHLILQEAKKKMSRSKITGLKPK